MSFDSTFYFTIDYLFIFNSLIISKNLKYRTDQFLSSHDYFLLQYFN